MNMTKTFSRRRSSARGGEYERLRMHFYAEQGYNVLHRATRVKFQQIDLAGVWDLWLAKGGKWIFVQITTRPNAAKHRRKCVIWLGKFRNPTCEYHLDYYDPIADVWQSEIL